MSFGICSENRICDNPRITMDFIIFCEVSIPFSPLFLPLNYSVLTMPARYPSFFASNSSIVPCSVMTPFSNTIT